MLFDEIDCHLVRCARLQDLQNRMTWKRIVGIVWNRIISKELCENGREHLPRSCNCISGSSIGRRGSGGAWLLTPGTRDNDMKASPAKSSAVSTSRSHTDKASVAWGERQASKDTANSKHSSHTGFKVFCKHRARWDFAVWLAKWFYFNRALN